MVLKGKQSSLQRFLKYFAVISGLLSIAAIGVLGKSCYDVVVLSDIRQSIRLLILQRVDADIERALDEHMPGPLGNRGEVGIKEPDDLPVKFENPMAFLGIGVGIIMVQTIHLLLSLWLFIVAQTGSHEGVRVWFLGTLILITATLAGMIAQVVLSTFRILSVGAMTFLLVFYIVGVLAASKSKPEIYMNETNTKGNSEKVYKPIKEKNSPAMSSCIAIAEVLL